MKKAFTIIEVIIVIVVLGILATIGATKLFSVMETKAISKLNNDYMIVTSTIDSEYAKSIGRGNFSFPSTLEKDVNDDYAFENIIIKNKILASKEEDAKKGIWVVKSANKYRFYISANKYLDISYNDRQGRLNCDNFVCNGCESDEITLIKEGLKIKCK